MDDDEIEEFKEQVKGSIHKSCLENPEYRPSCSGGCHSKMQFLEVLEHYEERTGELEEYVMNIVMQSLHDKDQSPAARVYRELQDEGRKLMDLGIGDVEIGIPKGDFSRRIAGGCIETLKMLSRDVQEAQRSNATVHRHSVLNEAANCLEKEYLADAAPGADGGSGDPSAAAADDGDNDE